MVIFCGNLHLISSDYFLYVLTLHNYVIHLIVITILLIPLKKLLIIDGYDITTAGVMQKRIFTLSKIYGGDFL